MCEEVKVEAMTVLEPMIKDCETLACDPDLSDKTRTELRHNLADWKIAIDSGTLSLHNYYDLIESVYGLIVNGKKQCPQFDNHYPSHLAHLATGKNLVSERTGKFLRPDGFEEFKMDI